MIFVDDSLVPLLEKLAPELPGGRALRGDGGCGSDQAEPIQTSLPNVLRYEELLGRDGAGSGEPFEYPEIDERQAASLCYTSGTTGNPKGVLYSHRSVCLHATASLFADDLGLSRRDRALVVVPMFHVNAWGLPYAAALAGADLLMPDRFLQAEPLARAIERERPTVAGCVPTIFADLLRYADAHEVDLSSLTQRRLRRLGRAAPADEGLRGAPRRAHLPGLGDDRDEPRRHLLRARRGSEREHDERYWDERALQGKPLPWTELRLVDDDGSEVAVGRGVHRRDRGARAVDRRALLRRRLRR